MIYLLRSDWFESHIRPRAIRRAVIAFVVAGTVFAAAVFVRSIPGYAIAFLAFVFGAFDLIQLKGTWPTINSLKISILDQGLCFVFGPKQTEVLYPWRSLEVSRIRRSGDRIESFVVADKARKRSHVSVMGYEDMNGLLAQVQGRIGNS